MLQHVVVSAPGKVILFGEHAVVYGHRAIACSVGRRTTCKVEFSSIAASAASSASSTISGDAGATNDDGIVSFERPDLAPSHRHRSWRRSSLVSFVGRFVELVHAHHDDDANANANANEQPRSSINLAVGRDVEGSTTTQLLALLREVSASQIIDTSATTATTTTTTRDDVGVLAFLFLFYSMLTQSTVVPLPRATHDTLEHDPTSIAARLPQHVTVSITSEIPVGVGLGSSAAFSCALVGGLYHSLWAPHDRCNIYADHRQQWLEAMNTLSHQVEFLIHGPGASGVDNSIATYGIVCDCASISHSLSFVYRSLANQQVERLHLPSLQRRRSHHYQAPRRST